MHDDVAKFFSVAPLLGAPGVRGPVSLNRLNPRFLRHCVQQQLTVPANVTSVYIQRSEIGNTLPFSNLSLCFCLQNNFRSDSIAAASYTTSVWLSCIIAAYTLGESINNQSINQLATDGSRPQHPVQLITEMPSSDIKWPPIPDQLYLGLNAGGSTFAPMYTEMRVLAFL